MARLPRLSRPGLAHLVLQRGHGSRPPFVDDDDRRVYLAALGEAAAAERVALHAWALADTEALLLLTPPTESALSTVMQAVGRRYVSAYNRRHGGCGTLWDGRFRCAVVEPGAWTLGALLLVDGSPGITSAAHRASGARDARLADPPPYWQLGNTPFEREAAWRARLAQGVTPAVATALRAAAAGGWAVGSAGFLGELAESGPRPVRPRPRGRPPLTR